MREEEISNTLEELDKYVDLEVHSRCEYDIYSILKDFIHELESLNGNFDAIEGVEDE